MYTYNMLYFGHNFNEQPELGCNLEFLLEREGLFYNPDAENPWGASDSDAYGNDLCGVDFPYHGGTLHPDVDPITFGFFITCDDNNPDFLKETRAANKEDYVDRYKRFLEEFIANPRFCEIKDQGDSEKLKAIQEILEFLEKTEPDFYLVEASS